MYSDSSVYDSLKPLWERDLGVSFNSADRTRIYNSVFQNVLQFLYMNKISIFFIEFILYLFVFIKCSQVVQIFVLNARHYKGTFFHVFWSCDHIQSFWKGVHSATQEITGKRFISSPSLYLLNDTPKDLFDSDFKPLFTILSFLAKKCILLKWSTVRDQSSTAPSISQ